MIISLTGFMGCGKSSVGRKLAELLGWRFADLDNVIEEREGRKIPEIFASSGEAEFRRMEKEALEDLLRGCKEVIPGQFLNVHVKSGTGQCAPYSHNNENSQQISQEQVEDHIIQSAEARVVLALGGGAVMNPECERMVHERTFCVYLRASVETLVEHLDNEAAGRPLLAGSAHSGIPSEAETSAFRSRILELMAARSETYERVAHIIVDTDGKTIDEIADRIDDYTSSSRSRRSLIRS